MYMSPCIEYLGHQIDKGGLHPTDEKVTCIKQAPTPSTNTELKAFMHGVVKLLWEIYP